VHGQCPVRSRIIKKKELLASQVGYRDEPMLAMDLIRNKSTEGSDNDSDEDPEGQEAAAEHMRRTHHVPGWVPAGTSTELNGYQAAAFQGRFRNITFRDCLAAMCESECNDLECDVPEEIELRSLATKQCPVYTCRHGVTHSPYIGCEDVGHDDPVFSAKYSGSQHAAEALFLTPKHLAPRARGKNGKLQKMPKRDETMPRTPFENRIVFDYLGFNHQVGDIRRFAPKLLVWITRCLHDHHSDAFGQIISYIQQARTIKTVEELTQVDNFCNNIWEPQQTWLRGGPESLERVGGVLVLPVTWKHKSSDYLLPGEPQSRGVKQPVSLQLNMTIPMHAILRQQHANRDLRIVRI